MALALAALVLAVWRVGLWAAGLPLFGNLIFFFHPLITQVVRQLQAGSLPLWNPYAFCGAPLWADPQAGAAAPGHVAFALFAFPTAWRLDLALDVLLFSLGTCWLARRLGVSPLAALLAGLVAGANGFTYYHGGLVAHMDSMAFMPLVLTLAWEGRLAWTALALALQALGGHPFFLYITLVAAALAAPRRPLRLAAASGIGAAALSAVLLVPMAALFRESVRSGALGAQAALTFSVPPDHLWRMLAEPWWNRSPSAFTGDPTVTSFYIGWPALTLAAAGFRDRRAVVARRWAVAAAVLMLGGYTPVYPALLSLLPGLALFRFPAQWGSLLGLGAALLAGAGLERLSGWARPAAVALVAADLAAFCGVPATARVDASFYRLRPSLVASGEVGEDRRVAHSRSLLAAQAQTSIDAPDEERRWLSLKEALIPSHGTVFGVREVLSDNVNRPAAFEGSVMPALGARPDAGLLRFLGVSVLIDRGSAGPAPRRLTAPAARTAWTEDLSAGRSSRLGGRAWIEEEAPGRVRLASQSDRPGFVTLADRRSSGWTAFIDGRPAPLLTVRAAFFACAVEAGRHKIVLLYRPVAFAAGLAATLLGLALLLALGLDCACAVCYPSRQ